MSDRIDRVNEVIKAELASILQREIDLEEGVLVSVVRVNTSRTLEHTTVWLSILPSEKSNAVLAEINKNIYDIQQEANKRLHMRPIPKITFKIDPTSGNVEQVDEILKKLYNK